MSANEGGHRVQELLEKIEFLLEKYSLEQRACTQPYTLIRVKEQIEEYVYRPDDALIRETLIEHVGALPIIATAFYPYLDDNEVDLGKALTMLAIHDIGELVTHDESTFTKKKDLEGWEEKEALKLLHTSYHEAYRDMECQGTKSAKFAKAIDKIGPDIFDYLVPADTTFLRYRHFGGIEPEQIIATLVKHKRPYMLWNPFMTAFHEVLLRNLAAKLGLELV